MKLIVRCIIFVMCAIILFAGSWCIMEKKYKQPVGIDSYSKEYKLIPLTDTNEILHTAIIVASNMESKILYSVPRCFSSRWAFCTTWANEKNDFFVCSKDIGAYLYMYNGDNSWTEFYIEKIKNEGNERYIIRHTGNDYVEFNSEERIYSSEDIPENVKEFIRENGINM